MPELTCWTGSSLETQPHLLVDDDPSAATVTAVLVFGVWTPDAVQPAVDVEAGFYDGHQWRVVEVPTPIHLTTSVLDARSGTGEGFRWLENEVRVQDLRAAIGRQPENSYYEARLEGLPAGRLLRYRARARLPATSLVARSTNRALWLIVPAFTDGDLRASRTGDDVSGGLEDGQWWVLFSSRSVACRGGEFVNVRLDLLRSHGPDDELAPPSVILELDGGAVVDLAAAISDRCSRDWDKVPDAGDLWPIVDRSTDSVLLTVPNPPRPAASVTVRTAGPDGIDEMVVPLGTVATPGADRAEEFAPVTVVMIHYAIQQFNDLFEAPIAYGDGARSYIQVTFDDERGLYSSRPDRAENGIPDGIVYALRAQRAYGIRTQWAFNAGLVTLLRHGLPDDQLGLLTDQVRDGLISVSTAGFAAHRPSYYAAETNRRELELGIDVLTSMFGEEAYDRTYYPDQRLFEGRPGEVSAYRQLHADGRLDYLVLDRSTMAVRDPSAPAGARSWAHQICPFSDVRDRDGGNYLWRDRRTGLLVLPIEDRLRMGLMNASLDEQARGQLTYDLRKLLMRAVRRPRDTPRKIFCYGDDLDHACGDGWFDGAQERFTRSYLAALRWFSTHPWVTPRTLGDPGFDPAPYIQSQSLTITSSICPTVDPGGAESTDQRKRVIHFDTWYEEWRRTRSPWLGTTLGRLSRAMEQQLLTWPEEFRDNGLFTVAWMAFLGSTHESMWSKQPIGPGDDPNEDLESHEPEDFVISESIQMRHARVPLLASVWGARRVAAEIAPRRTHLLSSEASPDAAGPLLGELERIGSLDLSPVVGASASPWLHWDGDLLPTTVLYTRDLLVVMDQNGGRITNIFYRAPWGPVSVSGTFKSHQFLKDVGGTLVPCDGQRLQNTVFTPNHAYVAADVLQAAPRLGRSLDPRVSGPQLAWYPDNFNAYETSTCERPDPVVEFRYGAPTTDVEPLDDQSFAIACRRDRHQRRTGGRGRVDHVPVSPGFSKSIRLNGATLTVTYDGVLPIHEVSNELALDIERAVLAGVGQRVEQTADGVAVVGAGLRATVTPLAGCTVVPTAAAAAMPAGAGATLADQQSYGRLHRVLTDDIRLRCDAGGSFAYTIEFSTEPAGRR